MKFTIEAETVEDLILAAKSLIACTNSNGETAAPVVTEEVKAPKSKKAKKVEEPVVEEPKTEAAPEPTPEPEPLPFVEDSPAKETKVYSLEDIRSKVKEYTRSGRTDEMKAILKEFRATRSTDLREEDYAAFMERCNG